MEKPEFKSLPSRVDEAKGVISRAPQRIEDEFNKGYNTWLECFGSSIFQVETYLDSEQVEAEMGADKYQIVMKKLEDLKIKHGEYKQSYPDQNTIPPDDVKTELLELLNIFE